MFRTEKRVNPDTGAAYPFIVKASAVVNQFYFYGFDDDFGPFFIKFGTYFPYGAKCCFNGHHWAQRQAAKAGIGFDCLDNGFAGCDDPGALQAICSGLGPAQVEAFVRKWLARLPRPLTDEDRARGLRLRHQCPPSGVLLDPGPGPALGGPGVLRAGHPRQPRRGAAPYQVSLIFERHVLTRGKCPTRAGPAPGSSPTVSSRRSMSITSIPGSSSTSSCRMASAPRPPSTTPLDFGAVRRLHNLPTLARIGFKANRRLLDVQRTSCDTLTGANAYHKVWNPSSSTANTYLPCDSTIP